MSDMKDTKSGALGCAMMLILVSAPLMWLADRPWMPRAGKLAAAIFIFLGILALTLVVLAQVIGKALGITGPAAERGEPPVGLYRLMKVVMWPYIRLRRKPRPARLPVETLIKQAADEGATELDLSEGLLETLPDEIWQLTQLEGLYLYGNLLTHLLGIGQLINLTQLALDDNNFATLPPELGNLKKLTMLSMSQNQFATLPPQVAKLTKLRELDVSRDLIRALSPTIGNLTKLEDLDLGSNEMTEIPSKIGVLVRLTSLNLDNNHLTSLPPEIGELAALESLYLSHNELASLPPEIGKLTNLKLLALLGNPLTSIPPEALQLPDTTEIIVDRRQVEAIPELKGWPNLKIVD